MVRGRTDAGCGWLIGSLLFALNNQQLYKYNRRIKCIMKRTMLYGIILIAVFGIGVLAWVQYSEFSFLPKETGKTWVQTDPIQCLGNPWQQDWRFLNNRTEEYPRDRENEIITAYYNKQEVTVFSIKTKNTYEGKEICLACSCPQGYTLYLLVLDSDVGKMLGYGYKTA